jgi:hypothetical protein
VGGGVSDENEKRKKRSAREKLAILVAQSEVDDAMREISAKSADELAGDDVDAARAKVLEALPKDTANVVPLRPRRTSTAAWALRLAAAAIVVIAVGYAWRYRRPDEPIARPTPSVSPPPSVSPVPPWKEVPEQYGAGHPDCDGRVGDAHVKVSGTIIREGGRILLDLDTPLCGGPDDAGIERVALRGAGVAKLHGDVTIEGRPVANDAGAVTIDIFP